MLQIELRPPIDRNPRSAEIAPFGHAVPAGCCGRYVLSFQSRPDERPFATARMASASCLVFRSGSGSACVDVAASTRQ